MSRCQNIYQQAYQKLHEAFGPQGWWPVNGKYNKNNFDIPRNSAEKFEIILGAILTQNTSWKNVEKALANLRNSNLLSPEKILQANKNRLAKLIRPSGYYNQKAERLKIVSRFFLSNKNLEILPLPVFRERLLSVKGIGPETADSIILYAFRKPIFVIDAYTKRIFSRLGVCSQDADYRSLQDLFHANLKKDAPLYNEYHALLVELAKKHCAKSPVCSPCPLTKMCRKSL